MPDYRFRVTRTQTEVFTVEETVTLPTDDPVKAQAYIEVALAHPSGDSRNPLQHHYWTSPERSVTQVCEILGDDPEGAQLAALPAIAPLVPRIPLKTNDDPDFSEVPPAPAQAPSVAMDF